jgi:hypothetical protein
MTKFNKNFEDIVDDYWMGVSSDEDNKYSAFQIADAFRAGVKFEQERKPNISIKNLEIIEESLRLAIEVSKRGDGIEFNKFLNTQEIILKLKGK